MNLKVFNPQKEILQEHISHYYFLKCVDDIKPYLIFPNLFTIITVFKNAKITKSDGKVFIEETFNPKCLSYLVGPFDEMLKVHYLGNIEEITICFFNLNFNYFNVNQSYFLKDKLLSPWEFCPKTNEVFTSIFEEEDIEKKALLLEAYLAKKILPFEHLFLDKAINILHQEPEIRVAELAARLYTTPKTLWQHFNKYIGRTPVEYKRLLRFHKLCRKNEINLTTLSNAMLYFDQAHMIKDFKLLTGFNPKQFFKQKKKRINRNIVWLNDQLQ